MRKTKSKKPGITKSEKSFDPVWEQKYAGGHKELYPWDIVVTFIFRNAPRNKPRGEVSILEVGCGTGSNLWFAAREGFRVAGIDASRSAIAVAKSRFSAEKLTGDFRIGDFTTLPFGNKTFDLAIDRGSLTHSDRESVTKAVSEIHRVLKPKGRFLFNAFSSRHKSAKSGRAIGDGLRTDITKGTLVGVGQVCFYSQRDVENMFSQGWRFLSLEHLVKTEMSKKDRSVHAEWRAVVERI